MYLVVINPLGAVTSLDLQNLAIWRLALRTIDWPGSIQKGLSLGIEYVNAGTSGHATVVAINCLVEEKDTVDPIARLGLPGRDKGEIKERLCEALKALVNSNVANKDVDDILVAAKALVDCQQALVQAMWGFNPPLAAMGADAKGELQGWRWAILKSSRFAPWIADGAGTMSSGMSSGVTPVAVSQVAGTFEPPKAPAAPVPTPAPTTAAPVMPPGPDPLVPADPLAGIGPAPTTEQRPRARKKGNP